MTCERRNGGESETSLGLETGLGAVHSDPGIRLMVGATLSMLVAHEDSRYDEYRWPTDIGDEDALRELLTLNPANG